MADIPPIAGQLTLDTSKFEHGIKKATQETKNFQNATEHASAATHKHSGLLSTSGLMHIAEAAGAAFAAEKVFEFAKASFEAAEKQEVANKRIEQVTKSMGLVGGAYEGGVERLDKYSQSLARQIGVEDSSIKAVQGKLLTFSNVGKTMNEAGGAMDRATQAAYNLASAGFGNAESNATKLGKALQDPVKGSTALARVGVTLTQAQKDQIAAFMKSGQVAQAQGIILGALEKKVGGVAEATATGAQKMEVAFNQFKEKIGTSLIPVFNKIFDAIGPILDELSGPLTQVMSTVASLIGGLLTTAIKALMPAITPLVENLSRLASQIGPILAPILEKVGVLFTKLMSAIMPLLNPLSDLIITVLGAAGDILNVVADALIQVVDALAPLLKAVGTLLAPISQLINVVFKAIMPILQPLIPVIGLLATIIGDVLTRAVGIIEMAMGTWLLALGKVAPFILNNVVKPVVTVWTSMAKNVVDGAYNMLGWVPWLKDDLGKAKDAVTKFAADVPNIIAKAGDSFGASVTDIGDSLVKGGFGLMKNGSVATDLTATMAAVGKASADSVAKGVTENGPKVDGAAKKVVKDAGGAAKKTATDPTLFEAAGALAVSGLIAGIEGSATSLQDSFGATVDGSFKSGISKAFTSFDRVLADSKTTVKQAVAAFGDLGKAIQDQLNKSLEEGNKRLDDAKKKFDDYRDSIVSGITSGNTLADAAKKQDDAISKVTDALQAQADAQKALDAARAKGEGISEAQAALSDANDAVKAAQDNQKSFTDYLQTNLDTATAFAGQIDQLRLAGASLEVVQQIAALGAQTGGRIAAELLAGTSAAIARANQLVSDVQAAADRAGTAAARQFYQGGIDAAQAFIDAINATLPGLQSVLDQIAARIAAAFHTEVPGVQLQGSAAPAAAAAPTPGISSAAVDALAPYRTSATSAILPGFGIVVPVAPAAVSSTSNTANNITVNASTNANPSQIANEIAWNLRVGV